MPTKGMEVFHRRLNTEFKIVHRGATYLVPEFDLTSKIVQDALKKPYRGRDTAVVTSLIYGKEQKPYERRDFNDWDGVNALDLIMHLLKSGSLKQYRQNATA